MGKKKSSINWEKIIIIGIISGVSFLLLKDKIPALDTLFTIVFTRPDVPLDFNQEQDPTYYVTINLNPSTICAGDGTTGTISSNMGNGICSIYWNDGSGTKLYKNAVLDSGGSWSETNVISSTGTAVFQVACYKGDRYSISNQAMLTVNSCPTTTSTPSNPWVCCLVNRQMKCVNSRRCPDGSMPIRQYSSESQCEDNCGFEVTTTTTTVESCSDSDGGNDIWEKGTCTDASSSTTDVCPMGDFSDYVSEAYCSGSACYGISTSCNAQSASCYDGRCIRWDQDSDGDGWVDLDEYDDGTDPYDPNDYPEIPEMDCNELCLIEVGNPWGGVWIPDPFLCDIPHIAIPEPGGGWCCCFMEPPIMCCNCDGQNVCMYEFCEPGCVEVDTYWNFETCLEQCEGMPI